MLALAVTLLAAIYLLGPDLLSRWIIGFVAPRKNVSSNRGEEVTRAVLWASVPLALASFWVWEKHVLSRWGRWPAIDDVYVCLSSTCTGADRSEFESNLRAVAGMNFSLIWREYLFVLLGAISFNLLIANFAVIRRRLSKLPSERWKVRTREWLATIISSQVSDWHLWLSEMLLPQSGLTLIADVVVKNGTLYQGEVGKKKTLGFDGMLQTLTLINPRRFLREDYQLKVRTDGSADREAFWRDIPGNIFIVIGSDITNVNLLYVRAEIKPSERAINTEEKDQILKITGQVETNATKKAANS